VTKLIQQRNRGLILGAAVPPKDGLMAEEEELRAGRTEAAEEEAARVGLMEAAEEEIRVGQTEEEAAEQRAGLMEVFWQ